MDALQTMHTEAELLRFTTAGSVDDGKSTLIGRLLYDTKSIFEDQMAHIEGASRRLGEDRVNLALLTDGLRAEREQKITIDVAYRYFATPRRKFIVADTPGHVQYTRNMITGASTADLAIVLVDARKGLSTQSRRHAFISSLLGIPHVVVAVNKMDAVDYSQDVFDRIAADFSAFVEKLTLQDVAFVPISALEGDNVVDPSTHMPWYTGGTLLHRLETVQVGSRRNAIDFRFPVQGVVRPHQGFRGYAGTIASGSIAPGTGVVVLPSGMRTTVRAIETFDGAKEEARAGEAVVITVNDEIDITRGDMIVRERNLPTSAKRFDAYLCWMSATPLTPGSAVTLMHTTRQVQAVVTKIEYRVDVDTLHRAPAEALELNEIARVEISTSDPIFFDSYRINSATGSFILIEPFTNITVAAGMIRSEAREPKGDKPQTVSSDVVWQGWNIGREAREARQAHKAAVIWMTGQPGAGKTTIARAAEKILFDRGVKTMLLDGDQVRHGLCGDLGFSPEDRSENIRRVGEVAKLFFEQGSIVLCSFVSPYRRDRDRVRGLLPSGRFVEVFVSADDETRRARDPKGLYARAATGKVRDFTGVSAPYEPPAAPELELQTAAQSVEASVAALIERLESLGLFGRIEN